MARKQLSLKLTPGKLEQVQSAVAVIHTYLAEPGIAEVLDLWRRLSPEVRQRVLVAAPTFATVLDLGRRLPDDNVL